MAVVTITPSGAFDANQFTTGLTGPFLGNTTFTPTASRAYFLRFLAPANLAVTKIAVVTTLAAGSNDNCDAGIFNAAGTTLISSAGSTAGKMNATAGVQQLTLGATVNIVAGTVYWIGFAYSTIGTTAATIVGTSLNGNSALLMGAFPNAFQTFQNTAFPLAASITSGGAISNVPVMGLLA